MPKDSVAARNRKRQLMHKKYADLYEKYKKEGNRKALAEKIPNNARKERIKNRCWRCERAKGYIRMFGICRICFRDLASQGLIPGMKKSSW